MQDKITLESSFNNNLGHEIIQLIMIIPALVGFGFIIKNSLIPIVTIPLFIAVVVLNYYYSNYLVYNKVIITGNDIEFSNKIKNRHEFLSELKEIHDLMQRGANVVFNFENYEAKTIVYIDNEIIEKIVSNIYNAEVLKVKQNMFLTNYKILKIT